MNNQMKKSNALKKDIETQMQSSSVTLVNSYKQTNQDNQDVNSM